jgi:hypothetical protein
MTSPVLFTTIATALRKEIPLNGVKGYDFAIECAMQGCPPEQLKGALARMTKAERDGFAIGTALKLGAQHSKFAATVQRLMQPPSTQMGFSSGRAHFGGTAWWQTPAGRTATTGQLANVFSVPSIQLFTGTPPANAAEAAAQLEVAQMLSGVALATGISAIGPNTAATIAKKNPLVQTGMLAAGASPTAAGMSLYSEFVAWVKKILHLTPAAAPVASVRPRILDLKGPTGGQS